MEIHNNIRMLRQTHGLSQQELAEKVGYTDRSSIAKIESGRVDLPQSKIESFAKVLGVSPAELMGIKDKDIDTDSTTPLPIIGDVAAGYNHIAYESYTNETVDVPTAWLRGKSISNFFALKVCGNSMYPMYMDGDIVVVLKQNTMNRSGEIGVVAYEDDNATLKKVEYVMGEDWMRLIPINPNYEPITIEGESLEHCRVLGIPQMLIRDVRDK